MSRTFISYSHDSPEHRSRVVAFADKLRMAGVEIVLDADKLPGGPDEGWPKWSQDQVMEADLVIIIASPRYQQIYERGVPPTGDGLGCACEATIIRQLLNNSGQKTPKFRNVILTETEESCVAIPLQGFHAFRLFRATGFDEVVSWTRGTVRLGPSLVPAVIKWPATKSPTVRRLADRENQFDKFVEIIAGRSSERILLLRGASNSSKSALVGEMFDFAKDLDLARVRADFKGSPSLDEVLKSVSLDVESFPQALPEFVGAQDRKFALLRGVMRLPIPMIFAFDTYEQANPETQQWIEGQFLDRVARSEGAVVVIGGQTVPDPNKHAHSWGSRSAFFELAAIREPEAWHEYAHHVLGRHDITLAVVAILMHALEGDAGRMSATLRTLPRIPSTGGAP